MPDAFEFRATGLESPPQDAAVVTPNDSTDIDCTRALWIGTSGDVKVTTRLGTAVTYKNVPVGRLSGRFKRVWATGTTASNILAEY